MKRRISPKRLLLFSAALLCLPLIKLLLKMCGYKAAVRFLMRGSPEPVPSADSAWMLGRARLTGALIHAAARWRFINGNCLARSVTLWWMLRWQRIACQIRVGMRKQAGSLQAHAWVECGGIVVNDKADIAADFKPFSDAVAPESIIRLL